MKSIEEIYRDFPEDEREKRAQAAAHPPAPPAPPAPKARCGVAGMLLAFLLVALGLVMLAMPGMIRCRQARQLAATEQYLEMVRKTLKVSACEDRGELPPGTGVGSRDLARFLGENRSPCGNAAQDPGPTFRVRTDERGNLLAPGGRVVHYRAPGKRPGDAFDLWVEAPRCR